MDRNKKYIYKNKKTNKTIITSEKLDKRQYKLVREIYTGQFNPRNINTK